MRVSQNCWSIRLNARERLRHKRTFPVELDVPEINLRRLPDDRYVVESTIPHVGSPVRLAKSGMWEEYDMAAPPRQVHKFSTQAAALNALMRGEHHAADDDHGVGAAA